MKAVRQEYDAYVIDNMKSIKLNTDGRKAYHSLKNSQWFFRFFCVSHVKFIPLANAKQMIHRRRM